MKRIAIFISGRGSNMQAILAACQNGILKDKAEVVCVFSNVETAKGLETAATYGVATHSVPSKGLKRNAFDEKVLSFLENQAIDYIILAGYMRILSKKFVQRWQGRLINIHPADTRKHQGLGAYEWAYEQGLEETSITVHYVDEGVDTGRIIDQAKVDLTGVKTLEEVQQRGLAIEHSFYSETLAKLFAK